MTKPFMPPNPEAARAVAWNVDKMVRDGAGDEFIQAWFTRHHGKMEAIPSGFLIGAHGSSYRCDGTAREALTRWADQVRQDTAPDPLAVFVEIYQGRDHEELLHALEAAVRTSGGAWYVPGRNDHWPPSHMSEISIYGVMAMGSSRRELAANWWKVATRSLTPEDAA